ncbi:acyl-CoA thioesterase [Halobacteria archaeon AArc-m2/3/4]|uniref:Acyl-CoA thioesterase n=1 Tax=Natronoglomus mannanivorans TaxID=2979990 RepID=A0ABT2QL03_9EURY|nr:acyl-CoA thioesterase [Halobacteria archaeon AArc-m2/3/4]
MDSDIDNAFTVDVHVRYSDLDTYNHVNNAVYATYLEEARIAYIDEVLDVDVNDFTFVVANLELSFERPVEMTDTLSVALETTNLGRSSATMVYELRDAGERVATGETTLVYVDPDEKRPAELPSPIRESIVAFEGLEE